MTPRSESLTWVFGYGSLLQRRGPDDSDVSDPGDGQPHLARLSGYRRTWNVAMDNSIDLPGYKFYLAPDGTRPEVFVTFLNVERDDGTVVNGLLFPVVEKELDLLDARERNYTRVDVTGRVADAPEGRLWTYIGAPDARERYELGMKEGRAVVSRAYYEGVVNDFAALGESAVAEFNESTVTPQCPVVELKRIDLD